MREYEFRGYAVEEMVDSQWLYGYGVTKINYTDGTSSVHLLTPYGDYRVKEESVGEYIGIKDMNGTKIFVGDILEMPDDELYFEVAFDKSDLRYCATEFVLRTNYDLSDFIVANDNREDVINGLVVGNTHENEKFLEE